MSNVHIVRRGDTLSRISKSYGVTIRELQNINHLPDPDKLQVGQKIQLKKERVLGFQALFLDKDRNAIKGLHYQFAFAGRVLAGTTDEGGLTKKIMTATPQDEVSILVLKLDRTLKEVTKATSGYGNKLVTLVSPSVKVEGRTQPHPALKRGQLPNLKEKSKPAYDVKIDRPATGEKKDLGLKVSPTKTPDGAPITKLEGDIPDLSFLGEYVGGTITQRDIQAAAQELNCEPGLVYAIAKQESGHSSFIKLGSRIVPTILFERHWFRKLTKEKKLSKSPFEKLYPDICGPAYHRTKRRNINGKMQLIDSITGMVPVADDIYGPSGLAQYKRLAKAYQLNPVAALKSCSWGKFQIMGFNFKSAGYKDVFSFVKEMSSGDPAHIKAFLLFAKSNPTLLSGLRTKDYEKIAEGHNGNDWRTINSHYARNIEKFSKEYKE